MKKHIDMFTVEYRREPSYGYAAQEWAKAMLNAAKAKTQLKVEQDIWAAQLKVEQDIWAAQLKVEQDRWAATVGAYADKVRTISSLPSVSGRNCGS